MRIEAILITHCHFDHIGAVAPLARATGAPVYCPEIERPVLEDIRLGTPPGFGPFENYVPEHTLAGRRVAEARGPRHRGAAHAGPQPRPPHVLAARTRGDPLRRRAVPGLDRAHGPAVRRPSDARTDARDARAHAAGARRPCIPATWASRRSAASSPRTRSSSELRPDRRGLRSARRLRVWAAVERSRPHQSAARHVRRARRAVRRARCARGEGARDPRGRRLRAHRDARRSRRPSCSRAAWGSRRTSSARRCTPSRTPPDAR